MGRDAIKNIILQHWINIEFDWELKMKIEIYLEENEMGTPIELASALIRTKLDNVNDFDLEELRKKELAEIAEHIQVFLKYWK